MDDNKFKKLVGTASLAIIAGAVLVVVALLAGGGWMVWRYFSYQAALKQCGLSLGLSPLAIRIMNEAALRYGDRPTTYQCMEEKGFPQP